MFFLELYHQSAEDLPETFQAQDVDAQMSMEQGFEVGTDMALCTKQIEKVEEVFSIAQNIMALSAVSLSTVPLRHLPPGKPMALYWQFQSWCEAAADFSGDPNNVKTPSWSTFWRAWSDKWSYSERSRSTKSALTALPSGSPSRARGRALQRRWSWLASGASIFERSTTTGSYIGAYGGAPAPT